jgi:diadenosine tetraphosphatase ApaH/serine/threonine PP2A family protein phosphatase
LQAVLVDAAERGLERFIFLGDAVVNGPEPQAVFDMLADLEMAAWVQGNTDDWFDDITPEWEPATPEEKRALEYLIFAQKYLSPEAVRHLGQLPFSASLELGERRVLCVHGSPRSSSEGIGPAVTTEEILDMTFDVAEQIVLCGHTHASYEGYVGDRRIINPGAVGYSYDGDPRAAYGILTVTKGGDLDFEHIRVAYDRDEAIARARERGLPFIDRYESLLLYAQRV